jgi:hypothetical protein
MLHRLGSVTTAKALVNCKPAADNHSDACCFRLFPSIFTISFILYCRISRSCYCTTMRVTKCDTRNKQVRPQASGRITCQTSTRTQTHTTPDLKLRRRASQSQPAHTLLARLTRSTGLPDGMTRLNFFATPFAASHSEGLLF